MEPPTGTPYGNALWEHPVDVEMEDRRYLFETLIYAYIIALLSFITSTRNIQKLNIKVGRWVGGFWNGLAQRGR